jgi:glucose/arabinose dehydrogenase
LVAFVVLATGANAALANTPPERPVIIEPAEGQHAVDPGDVHMATGPFHDADSDLHQCSDWEIHTATGEFVWYAYCVTGLLSVHIHLGDGHFINGEKHLAGNSQYEVRVRFRDSSGDPDTEWSEWSPRFFATGASSGVYPLEILDVLDSPAPRLRDETGAPLTLPASALIALVAETGEPLLQIDAQHISNPPPLKAHTRARVVVTSGKSLSLPPSNLDLTDDGGIARTIYLPPITLPPGGTTAFWIAQDGSSFDASTTDTAPNFTTLARSADMPWRVADNGYILERVVSGLQLPVNIAFIPHPLQDDDAPLYYITELYGTIHAVLRNGKTRVYASGLLNFDPTGVFPGSGEHGTVGTVVDAESGDVFVAVVYEAPNKEHYPKVIRLHSNDAGRSAASSTTVIDMAGEVIGPSHQISSLSIGNDGKLYVHLGDGFATEEAEDLRSFRGKILRMNLDGTAPSDNPFYNKEDGITATDYIYAYGFRNPFGGAWRAADKSLYEVENGPGIDRLARVPPGMNFRWAGSDDDMRTGASYNWESSVAPVNLAFVQQPTFGGSGFPANMFDHGFVTESGPTWVAGTTESGKRIREFVFDDQGHVISTRPFLEYTGTGYATVAALAAGPDGLYFSDLFPDQAGPIDHEAHVYRLRHAGHVSISASVVDEVTHTVQFQANIAVPGSTQVLWDFGDNTTSTEVSPAHTFGGVGPYDVKVSVLGAQNAAVDDVKRVQFPNVLGSGLVAIYSDSLGDTTVSRIDPQVDFDWAEDAPQLPGNTLNVTWNGVIVPSVSGRYVLQLQTDGSAVLKLDGKTIIDKHGRSPSISESIYLEAAHHYTFNLDCDNTPMIGFTQLLWYTDGLPARVIPQAAFYPVTDRRRSAGH